MQEKLNDASYPLLYGSSRTHSLLFTNKNVGANGENLTITILSYNRFFSTTKLLKSIKRYMPNYKGKILIIDNASNINELNKFKDFIKDIKLDIELVELRENHGVAGGRNIAVNYIKTEWFLSLDNDIYIISNPIPKINESIALLGCKFLNVPLLSKNRKYVFSYGGHLFLEPNNNELFLGGGSLFKQIEVFNYKNDSPSLSTFLFGGASVINTKTFIECGKFDDNMFIGFEDIDFSVSIFNKGYKIGSCPCFSFVHDHDIKKSDIDYEKTRFSSSILGKSAHYLENKLNFKIWNINVKMWLDEKNKKLGINSLPTINLEENLKKKIALIVDVEGWAFWNIAKRIKENLKDYYDFEIIAFSQLNIDIHSLFFYLKDFDLIHFFWRTHLALIDVDEYIKSIGISNDYFKKNYVENQYITMSIYDHLYLDDDGIKYTNYLLKYVKKYTVSSNILFEIYNNKRKYKLLPNTTITDGVNLNKFFPINTERFNNIEKRKIVIGWVGNSKWASEKGDNKGVITILNPVLDDLIKKGYPIKKFFADIQERKIEHDKMNEYYSKIDILICTSETEGTPNPILEAMACGVPIISTNVGIVSQAFGKIQKNYILKNREKKELTERIIHILKNKDDFIKCSEENIRNIKKWDWKHKTNEFKVFFDKCLTEKERNLKNNKKK